MNIELLDVEEAAKFLGISAHTLNRWRSTKEVSVPFIKIGMRVKYMRSDLEKWILQIKEEQEGNNE